MHREVKRVIGDDANKIRDYEKFTGRVYCAVFSKDGKYFAAGSSLDGAGEVRSTRWIVGNGFRRLKA